MTRLSATLSSILTSIAAIMILLGTLTVCATAMAGTEVRVSPLIPLCLECDGNCLRNGDPYLNCADETTGKNALCAPEDPGSLCQEACTCTTNIDFTCSCQ